MFGKRDTDFLNKQGWEIVGNRPVVIREKFGSGAASGIAVLYVLRQLREMEAEQKKKVGKIGKD